MAQDSGTSLFTTLGPDGKLVDMFTGKPAVIGSDTYVLDQQGNRIGAYRLDPGGSGQLLFAARDGSDPRIASVLNNQAAPVVGDAYWNRKDSFGLGDFVRDVGSSVGDWATEMYKDPNFMKFALTAAGAAGAGAAGLGTSAPSAAAGGTAGGAAAGGGYVGLNPTSGIVGLNPASGAVGLTAPTTGITGALAPGYFAAEGALLPAAGAAGGAAAGSGFGGSSAAPVSPAAGSAPAAAVPAAAVPGAGAAAGGGLSLASLATNPAILGAAGGALLGGLGGSEQAGTTTVSEGLPDWLMPYAKPALDRYTTDLQNFNVDPYGIMPSAMKEFQNTISGMYLDPSTNKYLEDYFRLGSERVKGALSPSFGHMQAFGQHSGYNEALSRGLGDLAVGLYGGNYAKERDRMTQMTAAAPSFLTGTSQATFAPYQQYLSTISGLGRKKEEPYFENPFGNILGGAFMGASMGNMFKS